MFISNLKRDLRYLPDIPPGAVGLYRENLGRMVEQVNHLMSERPDIHVLILFSTI